jgi:hypothetical protein
MDHQSQLRARKPIRHGMPAERFGGGFVRVILRHVVIVSPDPL